MSIAHGLLRCDSPMRRLPSYAPVPASRTSGLRERSREVHRSSIAPVLVAILAVLRRLDRQRGRRRRAARAHLDRVLARRQIALARRSASGRRARAPAPDRASACRRRRQWLRDARVPPLLLHRPPGESEREKASPACRPAPWPPPPSRGPRALPSRAPLPSPRPPRHRRGATSTPRSYSSSFIPAWARSEISFQVLPFSSLIANGHASGRARPVGDPRHHRLARPRDPRMLAVSARGIAGHGLDGEREDRLAHDVGAQLPQRRRLRQVDAAAVGRQDQVAFAGMDLQVVHGDVRQPARHRRPRLAGVERGEDAHVGADVEERLRLRILADGVDRLRGEARRQRLPGLAVVGRSEDVRGELVVAVAVLRDVDRAFVEAWTPPRASPSVRGPGRRRRPSRPRRRLA